MAQQRAVVRQAHRYDARWLQAAFAGNRLRGGDYFEELCLQQDAGLLVLLVAEMGSEIYAGHLRVSWESNYAPFREAGIPEIQDLYVAPRYRRRGIATQLLDEAEGLIASRVSGQQPALAGIGVGLHEGFGPAQRLYAQRGYVPDGRGAVYGDAPIHKGQILPFNDEAAIYLTKRLKTTASS